MSDNEKLKVDGKCLTLFDAKKGFIGGFTIDLKPVEYSVVNGRAMFEGEMGLGTIDQGI